MVTEELQLALTDAQGYLPALLQYEERTGCGLRDVRQEYKTDSHNVLLWWKRERRVIAFDGTMGEVQPSRA